MGILTFGIYANREEYKQYEEDENVYGFIYMWENTVNGKKYVGQTIRKRLDRREYEHIRSNIRVIDKAIQKYGENKFVRSIIDVAYSLDELNEKEQYWIAHYNTFNGYGYNCTTGGESFEMSEETKKKIGKANKGRKYTEEQRKKLSEARKGRTSPMKGRKQSDEAKMKVSKASKGRKHSDKAKRKMSENRKDRKQILVYEYDKENKCTGNFIGEFKSMRQCAKKLELNLGNILRVLKGERNHTKGYTFEYAETTELEEAI